MYPEKSKAISPPKKTPLIASPKMLKREYIYKPEKQLHSPRKSPLREIFFRPAGKIVGGSFHSLLCPHNAQMYVCFEHFLSRVSFMKYVSVVFIKKKIFPSFDNHPHKEFLFVS